RHLTTFPTRRSSDLVDITSRIKDLREQEKLVAENELLLNTIAHDIKNPLTALTMTVELLKRASDDGVKVFPSLLKNLESSLHKIDRKSTRLNSSHVK